MSITDRRWNLSEGLTPGRRECVQGTEGRVMWLVGRRVQGVVCDEARWKSKGLADHG